MSHQNIEQRTFSFCPMRAGYDFSRLTITCDFCGRFYAACCQHESFGGDLYRPGGGFGCHQFQLVFTDGACSNNGRGDAKAGLGITIGAGEEDCWSIAVDDTVDPGAARTNQRAELLAAMEGLKKLEEAHKLNKNHRTSARHPQEEHRDTYIVVTDSEYVVKGITKWFPTWRGKGWRTSGGKRPTNLDLFLKLDEYVTGLEQDGVPVGFWQVGRQFNDKADRLAKLATSN